ncbi:MAG: hypothetical protein PHI35_03610 [Victivallaceae bacterium]|nr:hypothetical protein [Victivallaceae bacterium]
MKKMIAMMMVVGTCAALCAAKLPGNVENWKVMTLFHGPNLTMQLPFTNTPTLVLNKGNVRLGGVVIQIGAKQLAAKQERESERVCVYKFADAPAASLRCELTAENFMKVAAVDPDGNLQIHLALIVGELSKGKVLVDGKAISLADKQELRDVRLIKCYSGDPKMAFSIQVPDNANSVLAITPDFRYGFHLKVTANGADNPAEITMIPGNL